MMPEEPDEIAANDERPARARWWQGGWWQGHRRLATACLVVLAAVVAIVVIVVPRHQAAKAAPPTAAAAPAAPVSVTNSPSGAVTGGTFAAGSAGGVGWTLTVQTMGTGSCLPVVAWDGQIPAVLFPDTNLGMTPAGAPAVTTGTMPQPSPAVPPGTSFAFFRVPAAVRQLRVDIGGAAPLIVTPRQETACGRVYRLAGFGFPSAARVTVTAITGHGSLPAYTMPGTLVQPAPGTLGGGWQELGPVQRMGPPKLVASADIGGGVWQMSIGISSDGVCFHVTRNGTRALPVECARVSMLSANAPVNLLRTPSTRGYFLTVAKDVTLVTATLPDGTAVRATPVDVYGVLFAGVFTGDVTPVKFTFYRAGGRVIDSIPWEPGPLKSKA
jgi:hypothetical protein